LVESVSDAAEYRLMMFVPDFAAANRAKTIRPQLVAEM
jgi:hypothetical protein